MSELYKIEKPDLSTIDVASLLGRLSEPEMRTLIERTMSPEYRPWSKVRRLPLLPGLQPEGLWLLAKTVRAARQSPTFIKDVSGRFFSWTKLERFEQLLNEVGLSKGAEAGKNAESYVTAGLIEEAIASSQLEGAHTTRRAALKMLQENRTPQNKDEQMILNNYKVIQKIRDTHQNEPMSHQLMLSLQQMLTEDTDVKPEDVGRFRNDGDNVIVGDLEKIGHIPPPEKFLLAEIERFIAIANDTGDESGMHPVIKGIALHFWIGYLHPFADGNGRFARAVFYWYLLRHGLTSVMYLPISAMIKKSPTSYSDAYIYSEQDDLDLTYFIDYNLDVLRMANEDFLRFLAQRKSDDAALHEANVKLNERQSALLSRLARKEADHVSIKGHQERNAISLLTARHDLYDLVEKGFLTVQKKKDYFVVFVPAEKTLSLLS